MKLVVSLLVIILSAFVHSNAWAALDFVFTTGDSATGIQSLANDSNKCPTDGPTAAYIGGELTNTGTTVETGVSGTLSNLSTGFSTTGTQTATYSIGNLAPSATIFIGWHITYPCDGSKKNAPGPSSSATITVNADSGSSDSANLTLNSRKSISANAGGNVINTTLGAGAIIGQTITADVNYDFGGNSAGDEFFVQPSGNPGFDADCLQLVETEVISTNILAAPVGAKNILYFVSSTTQTGNNYFINMRFSYRYMCANTTTIARPYAVQTSGNTNIKYTGNYDDNTPDIIFDFPTSTNPFSITKSASESVLIYGAGPHVITYTVTLSNPSTLDSVIDSFQDSLPTGVTFTGLTADSDVTALNSSSSPSSGATGTLDFIGLTGSSYTISAGSTIELKYTATVQDVEDTYTNTASSTIGSTVLGSDTFDVIVGQADVEATKSVSVFDPDGLGLLAIPGNDVVYTFDLSNTGTIEADDGSLVLVDSIPAELTFYNGDFDPGFPGTGPINFVPDDSSLTCCTNAEVEYSNSTTLPIVYGYTPSAGYDSNVRHIRLKPSGAFAPSSSASFSFRTNIN